MKNYSGLSSIQHLLVKDLLGRCHGKPTRNLLSQAWRGTRSFFYTLYSVIAEGVNYLELFAAYHLDTVQIYNCLIQTKALFAPDQIDFLQAAVFAGPWKKNRRKKF